jgi:hypothetical protein
MAQPVPENMRCALSQAACLSAWTTWRSTARWAWDSLRARFQERLLLAESEHFFRLRHHGVIGIAGNTQIAMARA